MTVYRTEGTKKYRNYFKNGKRFSAVYNMSTLT